MMDKVTRELEEEVRGLVMDAVGQATGNNLLGIFGMIQNNKTREMDKIVAAIEDQFMEWVKTVKKVDPAYGQVNATLANIFIRDYLYEEYFKYENRGAIQEWRPSTVTVEVAMNKVDEILKTYDRKSTDWIEYATKEVKKLNDPIAVAIFAWSIM